MKRSGIFILSWGIVVAWASFVLGAEPVKVAYVDLQRALNFCEAGKEAKKVMALEMEKMQKNFAGKQKELEKIKEDLEKRGAVLSETARREREREFQTKLRDLQRLQRDYEEELRRKERELSERIMKNLAAIVQKMGEEGKYTLILEKSQSGIIYSPSALDLTEELIRMADQKPR